MTAANFNTYLSNELSFLHDQGADLASASTITPTQQSHRVTGTTTINNITPLSAGSRLTLWFQSPITLTHAAGGTGQMFLYGQATFLAFANQSVELITDGTNWFQQGSPGFTAPYRKTTAKAVNNTVTATDLLNGEITIGAGALSVTGFMRFTAWGDFLQNSGATANLPNFQVVLGSTTLFDTHLNNIASCDVSATRYGWRFSMELNAANATNAQVVVLTGSVVIPIATGSVSGSVSPWTTGVGNWFYLTNTGVSGLAIGAGENTSAVDMTVAQALKLVVINSASNANYETKLYGALVELL